jgi:hypothetical protein
VERVRHIATTWAGERVAVASFDRTVAVWDIGSASKVAEFETVLDFGGRRLAISPDGTRVIAGAYQRYGIAAYEASTGTEIWRRSDLKKVQRITISADGVAAYCGLAGRAEHVLSLSNGETLLKLRGVGDVHCSPFEPIALYDCKTRPAALRTGGDELRGRIPRITFAFLDVAFAPGYLATSESGGPVRCFRVSDAVEMWRYAPRSGVHALTLGYDETANVLQGVFWPFVRGGTMVLRRFCTATGQLNSESPIPDSAEQQFCCRGTLLLTWDGSLLETATGKVVEKLAFPDTE